MYRAVGCILDELPLVWYSSADLLHSVSDTIQKWINTQLKHIKQGCYCGDLKCCSFNPRDSWFCYFLCFLISHNNSIFSLDKLSNICPCRRCIILPHFVCSPGFFFFLVFSTPTVIYLICCYPFPRFSVKMPNREDDILLDTFGNPSKIMCRSVYSHCNWG